MLRKKWFSEQSEPTDSILDTIKRKIYNQKTKDRDLDTLDDILNKVTGRLENKTQKNYAEMMSKLFSDALGKEGNINELGGAFASDSVNVSRIGRYQNADEICDCIPYCARALKVLADGIISPDDINKKSLNVLGPKSSSTKEERGLTDIKNMIRKCDLSDIMDKVIPDTLKYGDQFVELCDYTSKDVPITKTMLTEDFNPDGSDAPLLENEIVCKYSLEESTKEEEIRVRIQLVEAPERPIENNKKGKNRKHDDIIDVGNIKLIQHNPAKVIKLQSRRYKLCLGYLVLPDFDSASSSPGSSSASYGQGGGRTGGNLSSLMPGNELITGVDAVYRDLMAKVKTHIKRDTKDLTVDKKEILDMLTRAIMEVEKEDSSTGPSDIRIRYVPKHRMQHFSINISRFYPYGENIFYKSTFQAKLLIALQTAIAVKRISDSSDKRIMYVETGLPRDARNVIEELKTKLKKRRISIDGFGSISSIPSMITSFEDIFVPQSKGRKYVEFDTLAKTVDVRDVTEEMKFVRDTIVAGLEVPPAYVSLEDNLSNKSALTFENGIFAQTIVGYQSIFGKQVTDFVNKIYAFVYGSKMDEEITVEFPPPKMLQMERDAEKFELINRVVNAMVEMGVPREYAIKQNTDFDWDEIEEVKTTERIEQKLVPYGEELGAGNRSPGMSAPSGDMMGGGMGGMDMGMGGMGGMDQGMGMGQEPGMM